MRKLILFLLLFVSTLTFAQTVGSTDTPYDVEGWDSPEDSSEYYDLAIFRLLSNPGGWINRNTKKIDSLFNALIVYTDTTELYILNDTLRIRNYVVLENPIIKNKEHGFYAFEDSSVTVSIAVQNTWYQVTNATDDLFTLVQDGTGFTMSGDTITYDGGYISQATGLNPHLKANFSFSFEGGSGDTYQFRLYNVSNTEGILPKTEATGAGPATEQSASTMVYDTNTDAGDKYILQVRNISGTDDLIIKDGGIYLEVSHY